MNFGSKFLGDHRPGHSAYLVRRLQEAGFVIVGITNMPEFGILPTTEPRHSGPTRNPWDTERTPGGSSGGAAAAVASGMLPVAHGNDGGGSLRIPASCCGLVGLKPSRGRVSRGPDLGDSYLASDGVLTHTVAETAMLLDVLSGYEVGDATWAPRPVEPYTKSLPPRPRAPAHRDDAPTTRSAPTSTPSACAGCARPASCSPRSATTSSRTRRRCRARTCCGSSAGVFGPAIALGVAYGEQLAGRPPEDDEIEPLSRALSDMSREMSSVEYLAALAQMQALARGVIAFFAEYDVLLTPALAERPLAIGECDGLGENPLRGLRALRRLHALHGALQRHRPARDLGPGRLRRGRAADQRPARRQAARRGHAAPARRAARDRPAGGRPPPRASPRLAPPRSERGWTPSASASAMPRGVRIVTASSSASSQVVSAAGPVSVS